MKDLAVISAVLVIIGLIAVYKVKKLDEARRKVAKLVKEADEVVDSYDRSQLERGVRAPTDD